MHAPPPLHLRLRRHALVLTGVVAAHGVVLGLIWIGVPPTPRPATVIPAAVITERRDTPPSSARHAPVPRPSGAAAQRPPVPAEATARPPSLVAALSTPSASATPTSASASAPVLLSSPQGEGRAAGAPPGPTTAPPATGPATESAKASQAAARIELPSTSADYLSNAKPAYPAISRRLGEQGKVVLRVWIDVDGSASRAEVQRSSGFERLDQAALQTVQRWRYLPGKRGGVPEAMWFDIPLSFVLE